MSTWEKVAMLLAFAVKGSSGTRMKEGVEEGPGWRETWPLSLSDTK